MKFGEALLRANLITVDDLARVLKEQETVHDRIGDIALKLGIVTPEQMAPVLAKYFSIPFTSLKDIYKDLKSEAIDTVPVELARRFKLIPIDLKEKNLTIAMADPLDVMAIDTLKLRTSCTINCVVSPESGILEAIEYCYTHLPRMKQHVQDFIGLEELPQDKTEETLDTGQFTAGDQPVVQYVQSLIIQAVHSRASDILLKPKQEIVDLKMRIDGVLYPIDPPPKSMLSAITTRIKILSGLDIAERRLPQDGRFRVKIGTSELDLRTSCFPTIYGESVVMRLLDTSQPLLGLDQLGLVNEDQAKFRQMLNHSYGLILVTGPTGSGKTTTLYTSLNEIKSEDKNIITIEDPVEYRLPFIQQSQVNAAIGFDFARGLRSILRQDPDVIMVGEIRDKETAEIAIHAALTGHLVFSTLHTNDSAGAPVRLIDMGIEPFLITSSLLGVLAQRLIRIICPDCRVPVEVSEDVRARLGLNGGIPQYFRGAGCPKCLKRGYRGRKGIYELLVADEKIRRLIINRSSSDTLREACLQAGMKTLRQAGIEKLRDGLTTPEEVLRVTQEVADV